MTVKQFAYRLKPEGMEESKAAIRSVGDAWSQAFATAHREIDSAGMAADRTEAKWRRLAAAAQAAAVNDANQARFNQVLGVGGASKSAADSASVFAAAANEAEEYERKALALKAAIDPIWSAQHKLNSELAEYRSLAKAGAISTQELAAAEVLARRRFDETTMAIQRQGAGLTRLQTASRLNLARQGADVLTTAAMGMNPAMIAIQQGPQILDAWSTSGFKVNAAMVAAATGIGLVAAAAIGGAAALEVNARAQNRLIVATEYLGAASGLSAAQLDRHAQAAADAASISERSARDQAAAFVATGRIGGAELERMIALSRDYEVAFGVDAKKATEALGQAFADPARGAEQLNAALSFLDDTQLQLIKRMEEQGRVTDAQRILLGELEKALDGASDHATGFERMLRRIKAAADDALGSLGRMIALMTGDANDMERLADVQGRLREARLQRSNTLPFQNTARFDRQIAYLEAQETQLQWRLQSAVERAQRRGQQAQENQADQRARAYVDALLPKEATRREIEDRLTYLRGQLESGKGSISADQLRAAIAAGEKKLADLDKPGRSRSDRRAESLAREAASMEVNARAALALADAWLEGDQAALRAEASRKALTQATRRGTDAEEQMRRQLALTIADQAVQGARQVADLRAQAAAQAAANDNLAEGLVTAAGAARQMQMESQLRPLLTAHALAEGEAKAQLKRIIDSLVEAQDRLNAAQARGQVLAQHEQTEKRIAQLRLEARLANETAIARERAAAALRASQDAPEGLSYNDRLQWRRDADRLSSAEQDARRARFVDDQLREQQDALELLRAEQALIGASAREHDEVIARLQLIQKLRAQNVDLASEEGRAILAQQETYAALQADYERTKAFWENQRRLGEQIFDRFAELTAQGERDWDKWRDAGLQAIREIMAEMIKLALLNPLKNALFGSGLPTMQDAPGGGPLDWFKAIFGIGQAPAPDSSSGGGTNWLQSLWQFFPKFATGTDSAPGGPAWVGENGPELVNLPRGARVTPHSQSMDMARRNASGGLVQILQPLVFNAQGAVLTQDLLDQANAFAAAAANDAGVKALIGARQAAHGWSQQHWLEHA